MYREFDYNTAFERNIGWVTSDEQQILRSKRISIAGMGGVGGSHLLALTRLGVGKFNLADFDSFDLPNLNRQAGANMSTLGRPKVEVLAEMARSINPDLDIRLFPEGVTDDNIEEFLCDADLYVDGLDFFVLSVRRKVFANCAESGIPAVTAAPLGMGAAVLNFIPGQMTFEQYFKLEGLPEDEQYLRFFVGLAPAMLQQRYLVDPTAIDLAQHRGPSTAMGCELCASVTGTQALKILLRRGIVLAAPHGLQYDAYQNKTAHTWRPWGNDNPVQQLALKFARRSINAMNKQAPELQSPTPPTGTLEQILDLARWAPSGDNTQPWRFEILDERHMVVHGRDTREHCIYDLQGHASQMSIGALLETIDIAASSHGLRADFQRRPDLPDTTPTFDVTFVDDADRSPDPLAPYIPSRTVQRRPMRIRPLTRQEKQQLEASLGSGYRVLWLESFTERLRAARLTFKNAGIRLTMPEAYQTHRDIIDWNARYSEDKIPSQAVGASALTIGMMRWALQSWGRVAFMNRYLAGTLAPRLELDFIPGIACAAHFVLLAEQRPGSIEDFVTAGRNMQRFWLMATKLGLFIQPEMTPLIFHEYAVDGVPFSTARGMTGRAQGISRDIVAMIGEGKASRAVFMGRIGAGPPPKSRSTRMPLSKLTV